MSGISRDGEFDDTFDRLFPRAMRAAYRILGSNVAAEDVAAEAMARALANWPKLKDAAHLDAWVLRVAANLAIDLARRRPPRLDPQFVSNHEDSTAIRLALVAALHKLPRRQRDAVVLRYVTGLSEAETATSLGVSVNTVRTHVNRGLAALRRRLGDDFNEEDTLASAGC